MRVHVCTHTQPFSEGADNYNPARGDGGTHQTKVYLTQKTQKVYLTFSSKKTDSEKSNSGYSQSWGRSFKEKPCKAVASLS